MSKYRINREINKENKPRCINLVNFVYFGTPEFQNVARNNVETSTTGAHKMRLRGHSLLLIDWLIDWLYLQLKKLQFASFENNTAWARTMSRMIKE